MSKMTESLDVKAAVETAVGQAFGAWAIEHPNLANVIDRIAVQTRVADALRVSEPYKAAVAAYHRAEAGFDLADKLLDLASAYLPLLLL